MDQGEVGLAVQAFLHDLSHLSGNAHRKGCDLTRHHGFILV